MDIDETSWHEEEEWLQSLADVELPKWLQEGLPSILPVWTIKWEPNTCKFVLEDDTGHWVTEAETFAEIYDSYHREEQFTLTADPSVKGHGVNGTAGSLLEEGPSGSYPLNATRMFIFVTDESRLAILKQSYKTWLEDTHPTWMQNQEDWAVAYNWLQSHPIFWARTENKLTWNWETENGHASLWVSVSYGEDGCPVVMMEHGSHIAPEYTSHYHDMRLDVYARNFEEGYIEMAKLVHKFFDETGEERPEVQDPETPLAKVISERIALLKGETPENSQDS